MRTGTQAVVFGRGSKVREYWLAHAEGFELAARTLAPSRERVERVVVDPVDGSAKGLIVRSPLRGRRVVAADAVTCVDAFARVLHLEPEPDHVRVARSRVHVRLESASVLARHGVRFARAAARCTRATLAWARPHVRLAAATARGRGHAVVAQFALATAWLLPRLRGRTRATAVAALAVAAGAADAGVRGCARASAALAAQRRRRPSR